MLALVFLLCFNSILCSEDVVVKVNEGKIRGIITKTINGRNIFTFYGVPFAKPPINELRFEAPEEPTSWEGVRDASRIKEKCMQCSHFTYTSDTPVVGKEDCLYMNIHTPTLDKNANLNVIFFLHGGAFNYGSGNHISGGYLLDKNDLVLVTVAYRLGPLGFLSTQKKDIIPGNNGLKDQLMALKWIHKNIASFGGDPKKVTIAGMSAGAASVHYHMLSRQSRGYFSRAISMSGTAFNPWARTENSNWKAKRLAKNVGCPAHNIHLMVDCLKKKPAHEIVLQVKSFKTFLYNPITPFGPVVEAKSPDAFIDELPLSIIRNKKAADVPWLVAFNSDEGLYPGAEIIAKPSLMKSLDQNWNDFLPSLLEYEYTLPAQNRSLIAQKIKDHYLKGGNVEGNEKNFIQMIGERLFLNGIDKGVKNHVEHYSSPIHVYKFSYIGSGHISNGFMDPKIYQGAGHGDDYAYVFRSKTFFKDEKIELPMISFMSDLMMNFTNDKLLWPEIKKNSKFTYLNINGSEPGMIRVEETDGFGQTRFWDQFNLKED